jgi:poly(3-hydroxybutyrate) depolymerase
MPPSGPSSPDLSRRGEASPQTGPVRLALPARPWPRRAAVLVAAALLVGGGAAVGAPAESTPSTQVGVLEPDPLVAPVPDAGRPLDVTPAGPVRPVVLLALHGYTSGPEQLRARLGTDRLARDLDATVVMPTGVGRRTSWNAGGCCGSAARSGIDDVGFLTRTIHRLRDAGARQVFVVGYSNGGMLGYRLACERPDLVDGLVVVNGTVTTAACEGAFEALHLAGEVDRAVPVEGAQHVSYLFTGFPPLADLRGLAPNADVEVRVLPGVGHEIDASVEGLVREWVGERIA